MTILRLNGDLSCITSILLYFLPQLDKGGPQHNSVLIGHHYLQALHLPPSSVADSAALWLVRDAGDCSH
jgi:hypothetical protein